MEHATTRTLELAPFRGFGPSEFWPFRRRSQAIDVASDFAQVRRTMREECPCRPGVYGMLDRRGQLIYVGMSTVLPKRLVTYFQSGANERKEYRIASHTRRLVWEVLGHGLAAELRELELIRRHQPRFNVRGRRSGRALGYLYISREEAPRVRVARQVPRGVRYSWGPLAISWQIRDAVEAVNRFFKLRDCRSQTPIYFAEQQDLFSVDYRIECVRGEAASCLAPCAAQCSRSQYMAAVRATRAFLDGRDLAPLGRLQTDVKGAASQQQFERAAGLRDKLICLSYLSDRLAALREPPLPAQFVYAATAGRRPVWYLVAASRVVRALPAPLDDVSAAKTLRRLRALYRPNELATLNTDRLSTQILTAWFRTHPLEASARMTPGDAIEACRRLRA